MPRPPDPALEDRITAAALQLLDRGGEAAITMRSVAAESGTTTPTLYERFRDREALMEQLIDSVTEEMVALLEKLPSVEAMFRRFLAYARQHPMRLDLMVKTFGERYVRGEPMPAFDLLRSRLAEETGGGKAQCEDLALAIASLGFGTAQGMRAVGKSRHAAEFQRVSLDALRIMLSAFRRSAL
jgi:AcrR family transcriptional regulator